MATVRFDPNDPRRQLGSPAPTRPKSRDTKDTLCRNIAIYGHCRYADTGCTFNHDRNKTSSSDGPPKKTFNADTPAFTPSNQQPPQQPAKKSTFSSQAATAAPFTPRTASQKNGAEPTKFNPAAIKEFTPQNYDLANTGAGNAVAPPPSGFHNDPFTSMNNLAQPLSSSHIGQALPNTAQYNPYVGNAPALAAAPSMGGPSAVYYPTHTGYAVGPVQPPLYHLYTPHDAHRQDLQPWQRATYDFFMPDQLREELQKKMFATQQVLPNSTLPAPEHWHSLFPLDTSNRKNASAFGYASWIYKAMNSRNGRHYALRRLEGFRLTNEKAILEASREWKKIKNANIVTLHEVFTTREFGDSSLMFAYDYYPLSKTLHEVHFQQSFYRNTGNQFQRHGAVAESTLWGYICQITNALKTIHAANLAARCLELTKIIVTDKGRLRLAACCILDVVHFETNNRSVSELQEEDLVKLGKVILCLANGTPSLHLVNSQMAVESFPPRYSKDLKDAVGWLVSPPPPGEDKNIDGFIRRIGAQMTHMFDMALLDNDEKVWHLARELENGRIARILMKMATITERGEACNQPNWSETGDRYMVKLFRDYVFHQVDADGKPRLSMGHMLMCLNKLDAGIDEQFCLTSRDNETTFVLTYREMRQMLERSFNELVKQSKHGAAGSA